MATPDPNEARISPLGLLCACIDMLLSKWESMDGASAGDPRILSRKSELMDLAAKLTKSPALENFRRALDDSDARAVAALNSFATYTVDTVVMLLKRCEQLKQQQAWASIPNESQIAIVLAEATGTDFLRAQALMALALALRRTGDHNGCIGAYLQVLAITGLPDEILAVAHDNVALTFTETGMLDQAVEHFEAALRHEHDPRRRAIVFQNRALAHAELGEVGLAISDTQANIAAIEGAGLSGRELPVNLDNAAVLLTMVGASDEALPLLERASKLFATDDLPGRAANAINRASCHSRLRDFKSAAGAFREAHNLVFEHARRSLDPEHYRNGFRSARANALPVEDDAMQMFIEGVRAKELGQAREALNLWSAASRRARDAGDHALALRVDANAAALLFDHRDLRQSLAIHERVFSESAQRGLARMETMALSGLASLRSVGAEVHAPTGSLGLLARSEVLAQVHVRIVADEKLDPQLAQFETYDTGAGANSLAMEADRFHDFDLAIGYYRDAIAKARITKDPFALINRLSGLHMALIRAGQRSAAAEVAAEIGELLQSPATALRGRIVGHRVLAEQAVADAAASTAIEHLRIASGQVESLRASLPQRARTAISQSFHEIYRRLAQLLRESGIAEEAFNALQHMKGRRMVDSLAEQHPGDGADSPITAAELGRLLAQFGDQPPTVLVDLCVEDNGLTAFVVDRDSCRSVHVEGETHALDASAERSMLAREARLMRLCLTNQLLQQLAVKICEMVPATHNILLVPDGQLHNLPLHIIPIETRPWCDRNEISYISAAGALRFASSRRRPLRSALVAGDSAGDLPAATAECEDIAARLGTQAMVGKACSLAAIEDALRSQQNDIVHLAVHGRGDPKRGARASLLLRTEAEHAEWVSFDRLSAIGWRAGLVAFSGCSTAMVGLRDGRDFLSVADAATETGASAVIACLWPVYDEAARIFMTAFYAALTSQRESRRVDLREAFGQARATLRDALGESEPRAARRDGRRDVGEPPMLDADIAEYSVWAPFILVGDPLALI